jgi:hypothetical protein
LHKSTSEEQYGQKILSPNRFFSTAFAGLSSSDVAGGMLMKLRLGSAYLLFFVVLSVTVGALAAVPEEPPVWTCVELQTRSSQSLCLYDERGTLLEEITMDERGMGRTGLLEEGTYFVVCKEGLVQFSLDEKGKLSLHCGLATTEGNRLSYGERCLTTLYITGKAAGEWEEFLLIGPDYRRRQVLRCETGGALSCQFTDLMPGEYRLERNGKLVCRFPVEPGQARQYVRLTAQ